ncbi:hypothetical protein INT45_002130 [Circinella minor]|uniref:Rieske domain-containing protein n=1 Tax=Circinella minor TaxID=1195481 RepID=A0A8H7SGU8_9FUNG|nr:hypothetical protein INT45_002130 [Circinella minor]
MGNNIGVDSYKAYKDKKKMKKEMKKKKKHQKSTLGDPVSPMRLEVEGDTLAQDPETLRNTILNGSIDVGLTDVGNRSIDLNNGAGDNSQQKSVSFIDNASIGVAATESKDKKKKKMKKMDMKDNMAECSSSSSSSSSSSCSSEDETGASAVNGNNNKARPKVISGRPITPVSSNRIQVRTATGDTFECDRFCPHKGVDLSTWGQVLGNKLICTKHNWSFSLEGGGVGPKGRSVHPCRVNDW